MEDPMILLLALFDQFGTMSRTDAAARLTGIVHRNRRPLIQRAIDRGYLARDMDPNIRIRVLVRTNKPFVSLSEREAALNRTPPRTYVNSAMLEPLPPDRPLPGRPGQDDFKKHMTKYRDSR